MAVKRQAIIDKDGTELDDFPDWFVKKFTRILADVNGQVLVEESESEPEESGRLVTGQATRRRGDLMRAQTAERSYLTGTWFTFTYEGNRHNYGEKLSKFDCKKINQNINQHAQERAKRK
ncbi:MAG: hypothetical protein K0R55_2711 [Sporomusa sp.]|nr:hypothetical protein [Sporomusa sp.]